MISRVIFTLALLWSIFSLPWWGSLALAIVALWQFKYYYELVLVALLFDWWYGFFLLWPFFVRLPLTVISLMLVVLAPEIKSRIMVSS